MARSIALSARTGFAAAAVFIAAAILVHDVPASVTASDRDYAARILSAAGHGSHAADYGDLKNFDNQIRAVLAVQDAVLKATPKSEGLPLGQPREPQDLYEAGKGLCFDRSRVIEKLLGHLGLTHRHLSVFSLKDGRSRLSALSGDTTKSHAVTEVSTAKGWMLVDSNARWIGLDQSHQSVAAGALHEAGVARGAWAPESSAPINKIFTDEFTYVIGLYSRHGGFYWPYTPIPDYNLRELGQNLW